MAAGVLTPFDSAWIMGLGDSGSIGTMAIVSATAPSSPAASHLAATPAAVPPPSPAPGQIAPWVVGQGRNGANGREQLVQQLRGMPATIVEAPSAAYPGVYPPQRPQQVPPQSAPPPPPVAPARDWTPEIQGVQNQIRAIEDKVDALDRHVRQTVDGQAEHLRRLVQTQGKQEKALAGIVEGINSALAQVGKNQQDLSNSMQGEVDYLNMLIEGLGIGMDLAFSQAMFATYRDQQAGHHISALNGRRISDEEQEVVGRWVAYYGNRAQALQQRVQSHNATVKAVMEEREKRRQERESPAGDGQPAAPSQTLPAHSG